MSTKKGRPLLTVGAFASAGMLAVTFIGAGLIMMIVAVIIYWIVFALTASTTIGYLLSGIPWIICMIAFILKTMSNVEGMKWDFYEDRFEMTSPDETKTIYYKNIGHIFYDDDGAFKMTGPYEKTSSNYLARVDISEEDGERHFKEIIKLIKNDDPQRLFSYERGKKIRYSRRPTNPIGLELGKIRKLMTQLSAPGLKERDIIFGDKDEEPLFTVLKPYCRRSMRHVDGSLILIEKDRKSEDGRRSQGKVLMYLETSRLMRQKLRWYEYGINNGQGTRLGHFRIKQKLVSPFDDFDMDVLGLSLKLSGDLFDRNYEVTSDGAPIGKMTSPILPFKKFNGVVFRKPVDAIVGLSLILALNSDLMYDEKDSP